MTLAARRVTKRLGPPDEYRPISPHSVPIATTVADGAKQQLPAVGSARRGASCGVGEPVQQLAIPTNHPENLPSNPLLRRRIVLHGILIPLERVNDPLE